MSLCQQLKTIVVSGNESGMELVEYYIVKDEEWPHMPRGECPHFCTTLLEHTAWDQVCGWTYLVGWLIA
jgi:hypothetical protein